jgi:hypothetical protein
MHIASALKESRVMDLAYFMNKNHQDVLRRKFEQGEHTRARLYLLVI